MKRLVLALLISCIATTAYAKKIPGALYDKNGNLVQTDFAPDDAPQTTAGLPRPTQPVEWKFGNKPFPVPPPVPPLSQTNYRPAFGTYGVTRKWGDPNEFPCGTQQMPFKPC